MPNEGCSPGYSDREVCQSVHDVVAGDDHVTVMDASASATVRVDPVTVHADEGEQATMIAGRCPDFRSGRLSIT